MVAVEIRPGVFRITKVRPPLSKEEFNREMAAIDRLMQDSHIHASRRMNILRRIERMVSRGKER